MGNPRRASEKNAHPHKSNERIYIVHNGIIENHLELKNFLKEEVMNFLPKPIPNNRTSFRLFFKPG